MTDKELLELAAKAANYELASTKDGYPLWRNGVGIWNPLTDDGDALRLAVKLEMVIEFYDTYVYVYYSMSDKTFEEDYQDDPYAATRRAIVRAAAEIGKNT